MEKRSVDPRDRDRHPVAPCGDTRVTIRTPSVVSRSIGFPAVRSTVPSGLNALSILVPLSPWSRCRVRQHGAAFSSTSLATVGATLRSLQCRDARYVGPTSAFSRSSYEYSCLVGSQLSRGDCALRATWGFAYFTVERFASAGLTS